MDDPDKWAWYLERAGENHWWQKDGVCRGCAMRIDWEGARDKCSLRWKPADPSIRPPLVDHVENEKQRIKDLAVEVAEMSLAKHNANKRK